MVSAGKKGNVADVISRTEGEDDRCNLLCTTVVARRTFVGLISMGLG